MAKALLIVLITIALASCRWEGKLKFNQDNSFTILQLTDMHFGETQTDDMRTMGIQYKLINEIQPDLVVLTGDMFSGYANQCNGDNPRPHCYRRGWDLYTYPLRQMGQKYAIILGNHDSQADLTRKEIMELDTQSPLSLSKTAPEGVSPGSNYYLPIYDSDEKEVSSLLWMFDSHDEGCQGEESPWGCVEKDQIEWFNRQYQEIISKSGKEQIQGLSFIHIPPQEYVDVYNDHLVQGNRRENICCPCQQTGIVDALMKNDVLINFSGHDHNNDFSGLYTKEGRTIELTYGRKSGYGGYGPSKDMTRGGTVIEIKNLGNGRITVDTHIHDEVGRKTYKGKFESKSTKTAACPC